MTTTAHTPGPWELDDEFSVYAGDQRIARVDANQEANGPLITAGPEMLVACQCALQDAEEGHINDGPVMERLRAAIAKAEGRQ